MADSNSTPVTVSLHTDFRSLCLTPEQYESARKRGLGYALAWGPAPVFDLLLIPVVEEVSLAKSLLVPRRVRAPGRWAKARRKRRARAERRRLAREAVDNG